MTGNPGCQPDDLESTKRQAAGHSTEGFSRTNISRRKCTIHVGRTHAEGRFGFLPIGKYTYPVPAIATLLPSYETSFFRLPAWFGDEQFSKESSRPPAPGWWRQSALWTEQPWVLSLFGMEQPLMDYLDRNAS